MALKKLKEDAEITLKQADKGGSTIVMERENYVSEANPQLCNPRQYKK